MKVFSGLKLLRQKPNTNTLTVKVFLLGFWSKRVVFFFFGNTILDFVSLGFWKAIPSFGAAFGSSGA